MLFGAPEGYSDPVGSIAMALPSRHDQQIEIQRSLSRLRWPEKGHRTPSLAPIPSHRNLDDMGPE
jgi:hypothetical protein